MQVFWSRRAGMILPDEGTGIKEINLNSVTDCQWLFAMVMS